MLFVVFETVAGFTDGLELAVGVGVGAVAVVGALVDAGAGAEFLLAEPQGMKRYFPTPEVETSGLGDFDDRDNDINPIFRNCLR